MAVTTLAIRDSVAPPTANFTEPDPKCDLDYVPNEARPLRIGAALSNSFAFGGLNAVLAVKSFRGCRLPAITVAPRHRPPAVTTARWPQRRVRRRQASPAPSRPLPAPREEERARV